MDDDQQRREDLSAGLSMIDAIRAGRDWTRKPDADALLPVSRLAILEAAEAQTGQPAGRPKLRLIQGGKSDW